MTYNSYILSLIFTLCFQVLPAQFKNVCIVKNIPAEELSIAINPLNPKQILCGSNSGFYNSSDTGRSWHLQNLSCAKQKKHQSPVVLWLAQQSYFSYLRGKDTNVLDIPKLQGSAIERECKVVERTPGKVIEGLNIFEDEKTKRLHAVWSQRDNYKSKLKTDSSFIVFSFASMSDYNWSTPERISAYGGDCSLGDSTVMGSDGCLGLNHDVYITWAGPQGLMFRNLSDEHNKTEKVVAPFVNGWSYTVGKKIRSNGLPSIACDQSNGEFKGRIYICWGDEKHGVHDKNVFLIYSDDQGENWTEPILVTYGANHKEQFMPVMTIDQSNGNVYIFYHDQQNFPSGELADVYLAQSKNGGLKFEYYRINKDPLYAKGGLSFGKNSALSVVNGIVRPLWMQTDRAGNTTIMTALIDQKALNDYNTKLTHDIQIEKTFSFAEKINIGFTLAASTLISAIINKPLESGFEKIVVMNQSYQKGKNNLILEPKKLALEKGNYTLTFYYNRKTSFVWLLED